MEKINRGEMFSGEGWEKYHSFAVFTVVALSGGYLAGSSNYMFVLFNTERQIQNLKIDG